MIPTPNADDKVRALSTFALDLRTAVRAMDRAARVREGSGHLRTELTRVQIAEGIATMLGWRDGGCPRGWSAESLATARWWAARRDPKWYHAGRAAVEQARKHRTGPHADQWGVLP